MDENLVTTDVNDAYCKLIGYNRDELLGKKAYDFASDEYQQSILKNKERILSYELNQFSKGVRTDDDVTLVVIKLEHELGSGRSR